MPLVVLAAFLLAVLCAAPALADAADADRTAFEAAVARVGDAATSVTYPVAARPRARWRRNWRFHVAPYAWLAGTAGTIVSGGSETDIDVPFSEFSSRVNGGFQVYAEARYKRVFIAFDGTWAQLGDREQRRLFRTDLSIGQRLFDVRVGYEIYRRNLDGAANPRRGGWGRRVVADVFVGGRYWYTRQTLLVTGPKARVWKRESTDERWDPFVGARFDFDLTRRWGIGIRGDIGGFGVGDAAQFTWQFTGLVHYRLTRRISLFAGWRALAFDTIEGSGAQRNGQSLTLQGPVLGLGFSF
ncbi:MAG: hypothetical protein ACC662_02235 [Planctomycetota bacterium]